MDVFEKKKKCLQWMWMWYFYHFVLGERVISYLYWSDQESSPVKSVIVSEYT